MSLLHHFGQVKRKYEPYVSPVPGFDFRIYPNGIRINPETPNSVLDSTSGVSMFEMSSSVQSHFLTNLILKPISGSSGRYYIQSLKYNPNQSHDSYGLVFTTLAETFSKCLDIVREKIENSLWKTMNCCPFVNILDLFILKHYDTDAHLAHLEKMIVGLMDDNKTLQTKINSLEQQLSLLKKKDIVKDLKDSASTVAKEMLKPEVDIPIVTPTAVARPVEEVWFDLE